MAYADLTFYKQNFYGTKIPDDVFPYWAEQSSDRLVSYLDSITDDTRLKKACCAVAEVLYSGSANNGMTSEKVGDYAVNYEQKDIDKELISALSVYFDQGVGWI